MTSQVVASAPLGVSTGDFDGDGDLDVAVAAMGHGAWGENVGSLHAGSYTLFLNDGQGILVPEHAWPEHGAQPLVGKVEAAKSSLLVGSNWSPSMSVVRIVPGAVQRESVLTKQLPMYVDSFGLADIDRDGTVEPWAYGHDFEGSSYFVSETFDWSDYGGDDVSYDGLRATRARAADVDGDGIAELVTDGAFRRGAVVVSRQDGTTQLSVLGLRAVLAFVDLNADGRPDAIHGADAENPAIVSFRARDGTYEQAGVLAGSQGAHLVEAEDLDHDGDQDVIWLAKGDLSVSLQGPSGVFGPPRKFSGRDLRDFELADLDQDGMAEILAVDFSDGTLLTIPLHVLLGDRPACEMPTVSCEIASPRSIPISVTASAWIHAADVNGDGAPEIYAADGSKVVTQYVPSVKGADVQSILVDLPVERIFSADIDGTGRDVLFGYVRPSAACGSTTGLARLHPDESALRWSAHMLHEERNENDSRRDPFTAEAADLDGDGREELLVRADAWFAERSMAIYRFGDGKRATRIETAGDSPCGYEGHPNDGPTAGLLYGMRAADVDGDGRTDLLFRGMNAFGLQASNGTFRMQCHRFRRAKIASIAPTLEDVTADGIPDALFWAPIDHTGPWSGFIAEGRGGGEFAEPRAISARLENAFSSRLHSGGAPVILSRSNEGGVFSTLLASGGPGGLGPQASVPGGELARILGDVDGDGTKELILVDRTSISIAAVRCGEARQE